MTINNYYDIYIEDVKKLARTICIKSEATASALNTYLVDYYGEDSVNPSNPATWRYYLNISGQYHSKDKLMYVTSMDTLETIVFSKENLAIHTATARYYQYGQKKYRDLVALYPEQELLIKGILYPAKLETAISAEDGTILAYPTELIEQNEFTFIQNLQKWINGFKLFWTNKNFSISHSLYQATNHAIMYAGLIPAILNIRLKACKTNEVHSFHRRMYLASHGYLDSYLDFLTLEQSLFLYRNILFLNKNVGKQTTFDILTKEFLTKRGIPIAKYTMKHNASGIPENIVPDVRYRKTDINIKVPQDEFTEINTAALLTKEDQTARYNSITKDHYTTIIDDEMISSLSSTVQTKVIESVMVDESDSTPYSFADALINNWIYLAGNNRYKSYIAFENPKTGEIIEISTKEAYVFAFYCSLKQYGYAIDKIPVFRFSRAQLIPTPTLAQLKSVVDLSLISADLLQDLISRQPVLTGQLFTTNMFYTYCSDVSAAEFYHRLLIANTEDSIARGMIDAAVSRLYGDGFIDLSDGHVTFEDWFSAKKINIEGFSDINYATVYAKIVELATGSNFHIKTSLADVQRAMISIMRQLSSYSVQYLSDINTNNIIVFDFASQRISGLGASTSSVVSPVIVDVESISDAIITTDYQELSANFDNVVSHAINNKDAASGIEVGIDLLSKAKINSFDFYVKTVVTEQVEVDPTNTATTDQTLIDKISLWYLSQ